MLTVAPLWSQVASSGAEPAASGPAVNDQPMVTPAPVSLPPGKYRLGLEKGNLKASRTIDIRDGELSTLRVPLQ